MFEIRALLRRMDAPGAMIVSMAESSRKWLEWRVCRTLLRLPNQWLARRLDFGSSFTDLWIQRSVSAVEVFVPLSPAIRARRTCDLMK